MAFRRPAIVLNRWLVYARADPGPAVLLLIVLTLPLEFTKSFFPISWLEVSRVGMLVGGALVAILAVKGHVHLWRPLAIVIAVLLITSLVSYLSTGWPNGLRDMASLSAYSLFAIFVAHTVNTVRRASYVMIALILTGVGVALIAVGQSIWHFYIWNEGLLGVQGRSNSTFGDPNITARFLGIVLVTAVALALIIRPRRGLARAALALATAIVAAGLATTLSRWGWVVAAIPLAAIGLIAVRDPYARLIPAIAAAVFVIALILTPNALSRASDVTGATIDAIGGVEGEAPPVGSHGNLGPDDAEVLPARPTAVDGLLATLPIDQVRRYLIRAGVAMFEDQPVLGVGIGGAQPMITGPYWNFVPPDRRVDVVTLLHTDVVRIAAETGAVGLFGFAWFIAVLLGAGLAIASSGRRADKVLSAWLLAVVGLIFLAAQAEGRFYSEPYLWLFVGMAAGLRVAADRRERDHDPAGS